MKRVVVVFLIMFLSVLAFASMDVHNISVETSYPLNQILTGKINLTVRGESVDTLFTTNKGHSALLMKMVEDYGLYECIPDSCSNNYAVLEEADSLEIPLAYGERKDVGFVVVGDNVQITDINFVISSDFSKGENVPLEINFFESDENWVFSEYASGDELAEDFREKYYGDYNMVQKEVGFNLADLTYCSTLQAYETDRLVLGADFVVGDNMGDVKFTIFDADTGIEYGYNYTNPNAYDFVFLERSEKDLFADGFYHVCVRACSEREDGTKCDRGTSDKYKLAYNSVSESYSGFFYDDSSGDFDYLAATGNKTRNYGIYLREMIYDGADALRTVDFNDSLSSANSYILSKYGGNCSLGCAMPFEIIAGVEQNVVLSDLEVNFLSEGGQELNDFSEFEKESATVSFSGELLLGALDFKVSESGSYDFMIGNETVLEEDIKITSAPIIEGIFPGIIPAGIESLIFADVDYPSNASITYNWEFGDNSQQTTTTNKVYHLFENISEYNVKLTIISNGLTNFMETKIVTVSPKDYVHILYRELWGSLNQSMKDIASFPVWQQKMMTKRLEILNKEDEIRRIGRKISSAVLDSEFLAIASMLNALDFPRNIFISEAYSFAFPIGEDIDPTVIGEHTVESLEGTVEDNVDAIIRWQDENMEYNIDVKQISYMKTSGSKSDLFLVYSFNAKSNFHGDSFLVINRPKSELMFDNIDKEPKEYKGVTLIPLVDGVKIFEFYVEGNEEVGFFASPELRDLELNPVIDKSCNSNGMCEEGETYKTCRDDCRPVGLMIFYIILVVLFVLFLYTMVQIWYDKYYEETLFKKNHELVNLLTFVTAAKTKGNSEEKIRAMLKTKGWTGERVDYVIKKANGERVGLFEIIPITKISAFFRQKKIAKDPSAQMRALNSLPRGPGGPGGMPRRPQGGGLGAPRRSQEQKNTTTSSKQQSGRNINKGGSQNFTRGK
jgi:PKD repeat protein